MHFVDSLAQFVTQHEFLANTILFLGVIIEGEFVLLTAGILAHLKVISVPAVFILATLGVIGKTILGYYIGESIAKRFPHSRLINYLVRRVHHYLPRFNERPFWSIFVSKFIYGLNHFVIIFAGHIRTNFKIFFKAEMLSSLIWIPALFSIGYFFSYTAFKWSRDFRKASLFLIIFFVGFVILQKIINVIIEFFEEADEEEETR